MVNKIGTLSILSLIAVLSLTVIVPLCSGADSPQYILDAYAVDASGNPVAAVITPVDNEATIYIAVTTQVPSGIRITTSGFSCYADGQPRVNLNSISAPISTVTNANGSSTSVYRLSLMVPDNLASPSASFEFYTTVAEVSGETETAVTHTATTQLQYSVTVTATSTPVATEIPTPTATPIDVVNPSPTVPEFPVTAISIIVLLSAAAAGAIAVKKKQTLI